MSGNQIEELEGSELGTKDYWDKSYDTEIENYKSHGDVGEVWFDEDSQIRVINWMLKNDIPEDNQIIDLGCGNGMMLVELYREGYKNLSGVDYSENAIELAKQIAADQDMQITYEVLDLLNATQITEKFGNKQFDIVHDKGTYDAISIHPENPAEKRAAYIQNLHNLTSNNGLLILSSCNWTESELCTSLNGKFELYKTIPTPTFKFGGSVGSVVTQIVFKKQLSLIT
ncbi:EEF1A lysine methyltransferase 2 [Contarinia nasturtii]|uniref:EEF1A lysine methyltransferase 2 n=1 Tax=Contarinia nasturtii TaxID=265458 RepID=UPI0012D453F3|nr:EEF1A lysine methyltransferase 2 [Contarinia nasturtii]